MDRIEEESRRREAAIVRMNDTLKDLGARLYEARIGRSIRFTPAAQAEGLSFGWGRCGLASNQRQQHGWGILVYHKKHPDPRPLMECPIYVRTAFLAVIPEFLDHLASETGKGADAMEENIDSAREAIRKTVGGA